MALLIIRNNISAALPHRFRPVQLLALCLICGRSPVGMDEVRRPAMDNHIGKSTCYDRLREAIDLLAALAPDVHEAIRLHQITTTNIRNCSSLPHGRYSSFMAEKLAAQALEPRSFRPQRETGWIDSGRLMIAAHHRRSAFAAYLHPDDVSDARIRDPMLAYGSVGWSADKEEILRLSAMLSRPVVHEQADTVAATSASIELLIAGLDGAGRDMVRQVFSAIARRTDVLDALADLEDAGALSSLIEQRRQRLGIEKLRRAVLDPSSRVEDLFEILRDEWWAFGGRYVTTESEIGIPGLGVLDLPIRRYDNVLHIVKFCPANLPRLIVADGENVQVGAEILEAVAQAMVLLRELDRRSSQISDVFRIDCHRAFITIIGGHPVHLEPAVQERMRKMSAEQSRGRGTSPELLAEAIRTCNSHLSRIDVITYEDLLQNAEVALSLANSPIGDSEVSERN